MHFNETKALKQKIEEQNAEINKLQLNCTDYATTIQRLEETVSALQNSNENLKAQLQEKEMLLETLNSSVTFESEVSLENVSFGSCEEETTYGKRVSSQSYNYSDSLDSATLAHQKRSYSGLPNQVTMVHCIARKFGEFGTSSMIHQTKFYFSILISYLLDESIHSPNFSSPNTHKSEFFCYKVYQ